MRGAPAALPAGLGLALLALVAPPLDRRATAEPDEGRHHAAPAPAPGSGAPPEARGVALGLFSDDPSHDYEPQLAEIAELGASHVAVVVTYFQRTVETSEIYADPTRTPPEAVIVQTLRQARRLGLETFLFPYVRVAEQRTPSEWRGTLRPTDRDGWYRTYGAWIERLARIAAAERVGMLSLGSEMSSMDVETERWAEIVARVRRVYPGRVTYSANWDHYDRVELWSQLDVVGLTGYFELVPPDANAPTLEEVVHGWREWHTRLMRWQATHGRPIVLTEIGYRSNDGAAAFPWRWGQPEPRVDLDEQRIAYEAFTRVWSDERRLQGVYFWNWWGEGGPTCSDYTPRGKPAEAVLRRWFAIGSPGGDGAT